MKENKGTSFWTVLRQFLIISSLFLQSMHDSANLHSEFYECIQLQNVNTSKFQRQEQCWWSDI